MGMAALAVVLGVVALGLVGVLILSGAGLILLSAELWRDAARSAQRRTPLLLLRLRRRNSLNSLVPRC